ncbi:MAG TPA: serine/threonine-protein kinase [Polyangiaceae bacterium]|nr:serine/threonine-protein kinase [Polyangiaceae bacterium]
MHDTARQNRPPGAGPPRAELVGASLGKFRLLECIGRGGMGEVYLALADGPAGCCKLVVVKLLREDCACHPSVRAMFLDEGRLASRLSHPNVVQTNEVGVEAGRHYLVMEYLEGQSLDQLIKGAREAGVSVPPGLWVRVALDALSGLDYAHELCDYDGTPLNVVHRDLSPHNVFLTYEGTVKLLDFGIAKAATQHARTEVGAVKGKPSYMAPEQMMGLPIDRRADLFVFGIVLWEMLTGTRLFAGTFSECLRRLTVGPLPRASSIVPALDPGFDAVVARALERDPGARFQTAREMREAIAGAAAAAGLAPSHEALGELMRSLFRERHEQRRLAVRRQVGEQRRGASSRPGPGEATARPAEGPALGAAGVPGAAPAPPDGRAGGGAARAPAAPPAPQRAGAAGGLRAAAVAFGAVTVGLAGVLLWASASGATRVAPPGPAPVAALAAPHAPVAPPSAAPAAPPLATSAAAAPRPAPRAAAAHAPTQAPIKVRAPRTKARGHEPPAVAAAPAPPPAPGPATRAASDAARRQGRAFRTEFE